MHELKKLRDVIKKKYYDNNPMEIIVMKETEYEVLSDARKIWLNKNKLLIRVISTDIPIFTSEEEAMGDNENF